MLSERFVVFPEGFVLLHPIFGLGTNISTKGVCVPISSSCVLKQNIADGLLMSQPYMAIALGFGRASRVHTCRT